jgi:hypothetical protein
MKKHSQSLDDVEVTVWILMAILWLAVLLFGYLFWKHLAGESPHVSRPVAALNLAVCSEPRITIWRPQGMSHANAVAVSR